ncbi:SDR family oxidoreductase [Cupriavidus necator]|uniref:SDR family NAD(P)-dependent oxidoreductase n=1 Tax=Cupriavidus necator TaxID=106590 RepID=UPI003ED0147A
MGELEGKVALVSGGSKGMGEAIARLFAKEGATVALTARSEADAHRIAKSIGPSAHGMALEVSDRSSWVRVIDAISENWGRLDILVNSAGVSIGGSIEDTDETNWRLHMATNLDGVYYGCQTALPLMKSSGEPSSIINIASVIASRPMSSLMAYGASKTAMVAMTKSIALHCALNGYAIRANTIHPGGIETAMFEDALAQSGLPREEAYAMWCNAHPMGRIGKPEEVAQAALWLASNASSFTTGAEIAVDGGSAIRH